MRRLPACILAPCRNSDCADDLTDSDGLDSKRLVTKDCHESIAREKSGRARTYSAKDVRACLGPRQALEEAAEIAREARRAEGVAVGVEENKFGRLRVIANEQLPVIGLHQEQLEAPIQLWERRLLKRDLLQSAMAKRLVTTMRTNKRRGKHRKPWSLQ